MARLALFSLLAFVACAVATPVDLDGYHCASHPSSEKVAEAEAHFKANMVMPPRVPLRCPSEGNSTARITVPVYWHIIKGGDSYEQGNVP